MRDPFKRPVIRVEFVTVDGDRLEREWALFDPDVDRIREALAEGPPEWLEAANRDWPLPQGPIIFRGIVAGGCEDEAREFVHGS